MSGEATAKQISDAYSNAKRSEPKVQERMKAYALKYLPIVKSEVLRFKMRVPKHIEFEELHGVAICGLMRAFERYQEGDERFGIYVRQRVRGAILDELRSLDTMSRTIRKKARRYDEAIQKVEQREGRIATEDEIRNELGLGPKDFDNLLDQLRPVTFFSLDDVNSESDSAALAERVEDQKTPSAVESLESQELFTLIRERLELLPEKQKKILHMYYFKDFRLAEIAQVFNISESRACQLHVQGVRFLKAALSKQMRSENPTPR
ncbi:MAG: FliA/WhiG family RNA polymerase sigma factor [Opitutales bacterium]|nr:FliA/WhiG family RNA polymerase sigma factor [Opitutales bacterium]